MKLNLRLAGILIIFDTKPFGGLSVIFYGALFQLLPVKLPAIYSQVNDLSKATLKDINALEL